MPGRYFHGAFSTIFVLSGPTRYVSPWMTGQGCARRIKPMDGYPFLLTHVGTNDTAKKNPMKKKTTSDFEALAGKLKDPPPQLK